MSSLSQPKYQRQRIVKYAQKHSVTETAIRYKVSRKTVYKWLSRYDGTTASLEDRSHRPKTSPKSHTELELRQIRRRLKKHKWTDLILAYQELLEIDGYTRSYGGFKRVAARFFAREKAVFNVGIHEQIYHLYRWATTVAQQQGAGHQQILAGIASLLLGFAYSENRQTSFRDRHIDSLISQAKILMQENIEQNLPGKVVAQQIGMGYSWFRRVFKEYTGFSPNQYMQELKISKSKELLTNTDLNSQQIAYSVGFETPSYFNIVFKKKTGMTPSKYREFTQGDRLQPQNELSNFESLSDKE